MRIIRRNRYLVNEARAQPLDSPSRSMVVWVTRVGVGAIQQTDERGDAATCLECVTMTSKRLQNLISDMSGRNSNVLRIANTEVYVAHIRAVGSQDRSE